MVSPPRWIVVAGFRPSSDIVGTAKSPLGPARLAYEVSSPERKILLMSGSEFGRV